MPIDDRPAGIPADDYTAPPSLARSAADWATSAIRGLAKGAVGLAGQFGDIPGEILEKGHELGVPRPAEEGLRAYPGGAPFPTTAELTQKIGGEGATMNAAGKFLGGKAATKGGEYLESIGETVPAVAAGPGGVLKKAVQAVAGGSGSQALGDFAEKHMPDHETAARVIGGIFGQGVPGMVRRSVTPLPVSPERRAHVETLRGEGVEPSAGDVSGSRVLKYAEHALGDAPGAGGANTAARERIDGQYARAALRRIGENADRATPEVIERAGTRIGGQFDALSARNGAHLDPQFGQEIFQAQHDYNHLFVDPLRRPIVENVIENATNLILRGSVLPGEVYQTQRSMLERMRRGYKADPELSGFLAEVRDALDGVMERSIRQHNPADLGAWQAARRQYRNLLTLERVTAGAGEGAAEGAVSPARLRQAAVAQGGRRSYARGDGDFGELARSGNAILTKPPTSGTSERAFLHAIPGAIGGAVGHAMGGAPEASAGLMAGMAAPGMTGRAIMSAPAQAWLKNQLAARLNISPGMLDKIVTSALAARAHRSTDERGR